MVDGGVKKRLLAKAEDQAGVCPANIAAGFCEHNIKLNKFSCSVNTCYHTDALMSVGDSTESTTGGES